MTRPLLYGSIPYDEEQPAKQSLASTAHSSSSFVSEDLSGTATIASEVANMTKNLIGGGVLSLSGGIALYANNPVAAYSAIYWVCILGAVFGYFCLL